ncbi:MAG: fibronectin type III domain-containing protein [Pseudomonadota bacterium]
MRTLPSPLLGVLVAAMLASCDRPVFVEETREIQVSVLEPGDGSLLPLSSETRVVVEARSTDAVVEALEISLVAASCSSGQACPRLDLYHHGSAVAQGRSEFCLTTRLAPPEICADEASRLDVTGLAQGQGLVLRARAQVRASTSHLGQSGKITLLLSDDRAPLVSLESAVPSDDGHYGPGDRIVTALRVTDEQSGVGRVLVRTRGLGGHADAEQAWIIPVGASTVRGTVTVAVPGSFLCPGSFEIEAEVEDLADPPNSALVALGTGCVGACSDHTPPAFFNVVLDVPSTGRVPPFATSGDQLVLSFDLDDDVFQGGEPVVELVHDPPGLHPGDDKSSVITTWIHPDIQGGNDTVPGASYVYRYTVRGDEPPGRYKVRVTAIDPHCIAAVVQRDLLIDFTPGPTQLRVDPGQRGATFLRLEWDLPAGQPPPLHLSWQQHLGVPLPTSFVEVVPPPLLSPYIHSGLTPASQYAYRLVAESAVTPGLFTAVTGLDRVCTLPAPPALTLQRSTQVSLELDSQLGSNPPATPLDLYRCGGIGCGSASCTVDTASCVTIENNVQGARNLDGLLPSTCYAAVLVARGCDSDEARATVCARTQDAIPPPNWIQVADRTLDSVTFEWQRVVGSAQDAVTAYVVADAADLELANVPQVAEGQIPRHSVGGLRPGQATAVKVRVLRESGGEGSFSPLTGGHALAASPGGVSGSAQSPDTIALSFDTGLNGGECNTRYRVVDGQSGEVLQLDGSLGTTEVFATVNACAGGFGSNLVVHGLTPDSDHVFVLTARNGDGVLSAPSANSPTLVTWAHRADPPAVSSDLQGAVQVVFDASGNPPRSEFAILVGARYLDLSGIIVDSAAFGTRAQWNAGTGVLIQDLTPDTIHEIRLLVRNAAGVETAASLPGSARTAPAVPENLTAQATGVGSLQLQFNRGRNPVSTEYQVEQVLPGAANLGQSANTTIPVTALSPSERYSYRVRAVGGDGVQFSAWVGPVEVVLAPAAPAVPQVLARTTTTLQIQHDLSADTNPAAVEYALTVDGRYLRPDGSLQGTTPDNQAFVPRSSLAPITASGLSGATLYDLRSVVRGVDGILVQSSPRSEATQPYTPTSLAVTTGTDPARHLALTWLAAGNPAGTHYLIESHSGSGNFARVADTTALTWVDGLATELSPGVTYTYQVMAQMHGQASAASTARSDTTWAIAPDIPVVTIPGSGDATSLDLGLPLDDNDASVRYGILVTTGGTTQGVRQVGSVESLTAQPEYRLRSEWGSVTLTGLLPNTPYEVWLRARNTALDPDQDGSPSLRVSAATPPASLNASPTQIQVSLSWPASAASRYRLLRGVGSCASPAQIFEGAGLAHLDTAVQPGTTYCYQVHGINSDTPAALTVGNASASITTVSAAPLAPVDLVVTNTASAQNAAVSDSPINVLTPHFSARHQDQASPTTATRVRLRVRGSGAVLVYDAWQDLAPALAAGSKVPDLVLPYLIQPLPFSFATGVSAASASVGGDLVALEGGSTAVHRLDLASNQWDPAALALPALPVASGAGAAVVYHSVNNTLYAMPGGTSSAVYRLIVGGGAWTALTGPCGAINGSAAMAVADVAGAVHLFIYPGTGTALWVYNVTSGARDCTGITLPWALGVGCGLAATSNSLFVVRGGNQRNLIATSLAGISVATPTYNAWMHHPSGVDLPVLQGGSVARTGNLSLVVGTGNNNPTALYRYDFSAGLPASGSFTHLADQSARSNTFQGNRLVHETGSNTLYVLRGNGQEIWYFDQTSQTLQGYPGASRSAIILDTRQHDFSMAFEDTDGVGALAPVQTFSTAAP